MFAYGFFLVKKQQVGLVLILSHLTLPLFFVCLIPSSKYKEKSEVSSRREARCSQPLCLASSLHRASSPTASPPLSGSRAATHMVPCQIPGGSVGHVSESQQRGRSRVTMETEANGRSVLATRAEPIARGGWTGAWPGDQCGCVWGGLFGCGLCVIQKRTRPVVVRSAEDTHQAKSCTAWFR